jgi:hypothetical protein
VLALKNCPWEIHIRLLFDVRRKKLYFGLFSLFNLREEKLPYFFAFQTKTLNSRMFFGLKSLTFLNPLAAYLAGKKKNLVSFKTFLSIRITSRKNLAKPFN